VAALAKPHILASIHASPTVIRDVVFFVIGILLGHQAYSFFIVLLITAYFTY
jgi:hypothetical protein